MKITGRFLGGAPIRFLLNGFVTYKKSEIYIEPLRSNTPVNMDIQIGVESKLRNRICRCNSYTRKHRYFVTDEIATSNYFCKVGKYTKNSCISLHNAQMMNCRHLPPLRPGSFLTYGIPDEIINIRCVQINLQI